MADQLTLLDEPRVEGRWPVPDGWKWRSLRSICQTTSGGTPSRSNAAYFRGSIPWVKSGELNDGLVMTTEESITNEAVRSSSAKVFPKSTLLIAMYGATVGKLGILGMDAATNQAVCAIFPSDVVDKKYLFWLLRRQRSDLLRISTGGAQPNISQNIIRNLMIPLPYPDDPDRSLATQRAIVARIEGLFADLSELRAIHDVIDRDVEQLMAAVLEETLTNLFASYHKDSIGNLIDQEVLQVTGGGTPSRQTARYWNGTIPWASPKDMKIETISDSEEHISEQALSESSVKLIAADSVLFVVRGMILARTWPVALTTEQVTINQDMKAFTPSEDISAAYLAYILRALTPDVLRQVETAAHGTKRLKTETVERLEIPLPSKQQQIKIANYLTSVGEEIKEMRKLQEVDINNVKQVEQAILEYAFRGEL